MLKKVTVCDRCGKQEDPSGKPTDKHFTGRVFKTDGRTQEIVFDLCNDCWSAVGIKGEVKNRRGRKPALQAAA